MRTIDAKNGRIIEYESLDSTNDEALRLGAGGAPDGTVVVAAEQSAGRGRMARAWSSPRGGLWMSMLVREDGGPGDIPLLSIAAGVALGDALAVIFERVGLDPVAIGLGWPNDVLINMKKIAGILCESRPAGSETLFAVGVGLNVNNSPDELPGELARTAISVSALAGVEYPVRDALEKTVRMLDNRIADLRNRNDSEIVADWKKRSVLFGREVKIQSPGSEPEIAVPYDIDGRGRLLVKNADGASRAVEYEETTLIRGE